MIPNLDDCKQEPFTRLQQQVTPLLDQYNSAYRSFLIGCGLSAIIATVAVWWMDSIPLFFRLLIWLGIMFAGSTIAYRPLEKIDGQTKARVEPFVLEPFGLEFVGDFRELEYASPFNDLFYDPDVARSNSPFDQLDLLPDGEKIVYSRCYRRSVPSKLVIQEIEVKQLQLNRVQFPDTFRRNWRTVFIGQGIEAPLPLYSGAPFILVPRGREIHSLGLYDRLQYLNEKYSRRTDKSALGNSFQIWVPERLASGAVPTASVSEAALEIASAYPHNKVCIAVTPDPDGRFYLRMTVDIGRLYRDESTSRGAIDLHVLEAFQKKLTDVVRAHDRMLAAL